MRWPILSCSCLCLLLLLVGCPQEPDNGGFAGVPDPGEEPCSNGNGSIRFLPQGVFDGANWQRCPQREPSGSGPEFTNHAGTTTLVAGGSTVLTLSYAGLPEGLQGTPVLANIVEEPELAVLSLTSSEDDQPGQIAFELFSRPDAPGGSFTLQLGFDDGTGTDSNPQPVAWYEIEFDVVATLGGDLQFALNWNQSNDVDLHVIDPDGERVFYGNPISASGGILDLDSNAGCTLDGIRNENVIWETGGAPAGNYQVFVNLWSACGVGVVTEWRLTILERGEPVQTIEGNLSPVDANPTDEPANLAVSFDFEG